MKKISEIELRSGYGHGEFESACATSVGPHSNCSPLRLVISYSRKLLLVLSVWFFFFSGSRERWNSLGLLLSVGEEERSGSSPSTEREVCSGCFSHRCRGIELVLAHTRNWLTEVLDCLFCR